MRWPLAYLSFSYFFYNEAYQLTANLMKKLKKIRAKRKPLWSQMDEKRCLTTLKAMTLLEPRHKKTNILVSDLVRQKPGCTTTEDG